jgi:hypothetical protein
VASQDTGGNFHLEFSGINETGGIHVPVTEGWQIWTTVSATVSLSAGTQIMRFVNADSSDEYNINYFDFAAPMTTVPDVIGMTQISGHSAIIAAGLSLGITSYSYSDTIAIDHIINQSPVGGTAVITGSPVDTEISLGFRGDLNDDGSVDLADLHIMVEEWITPGILADIEPLEGDGWVDLRDFAVLASNWLDSN